ncbi:ABC transporter substrate-binding protein [Methanothermococcus okinawensis]|uniref:ABC-type transporter, periplasmic subunit n=1 Tax=Methanothermococcus okinawensis (strain DSM 14208 / JCM 11175 / IH1) TaxID=647113 RepID=F8AMS4_METOI|nr:ABC transporter substrate-binding protein [Methanothermococcus okinawensis]AEH06905.1 ABC-type transporter, periplasmic subunit [Methanothermococcus okinawensis IH1]
MKKIFIFPILALLSLVPSVMGAEIGDINNDGSVDIADVVYLFKHRNVPLDDGDLNCDNSVDIADVVYLFKNYDKFREPVIFAKNLKLEPHWDEGYCYIVDSKGHKFVLLDKNATVPNIPDAKIINVPVKRIVSGWYYPIVSTADILNDSSCYDSIKGVTKYTLKYSPELSKRYDEGKVADIGSSSNVDYDVIINISPDIVFLAEWPQHDKIEAKLNELGITVSRAFSYKEPTYMGRIEWVKYAAAFWGEDKYNKANNFFQNAWKKRNDLLRITRNAKTYPKVVNFWKSSDIGSIYIPESQNYYIKLINGFRGDYVFSDLPGTGNEKIDTETFMERARNADVVILRQSSKTIKTKDDLLKVYPNSGFENLKAFKEGRFYISKSDYYTWEARDPIGTMEDYAKMIHPELFPNGDNDLKHFVKLQ